MLPVRDHLPTRSVPVVNYALITLNLGVFGLEASSAAGTGEGTALDAGALLAALPTPC